MALAVVAARQVDILDALYDDLAFVTAALRDKVDSVCQIAYQLTDPDRRSSLKLMVVDGPRLTGDGRTWTYDARPACSWTP